MPSLIKCKLRANADVGTHRALAGAGYTTAKHSARNVEPDAHRFKLRQRRKALTANLQHLVNLRDHGKCQHKLSNGKLCGSRRYIHLHHIREVAKGGENAMSNLICLCSSHHRLVHRVPNHSHRPFLKIQF